MEVILPKNKNLNKQEIDELVLNMENDPHLYKEYIGKLKKYYSHDTKSLGELKDAIDELERFALQENPEMDWFANLPPAKPEPEPAADFNEFRYATPAEAPVQKIDTYDLKRRSIRDPKLAMDLLHQNPIHMNLIDPSIYTEEMVRLALKIDDLSFLLLIDVVTKPTVIKNVLKDFLQIPNVCEYIDLNAYLTEESLYQLGYRSVFNIKDIMPEIDTVYIHALCHGELIGPYKIPDGNTITRYSSIPLGVCESYSSMTMAIIHRTTTYENFLENHQLNMMKLIKRTDADMDTKTKRGEAVRHLTSVPTKTFKEGKEIMNKWFSSLDRKGPFCINFLDIVTPSGKYNLFSIKPEWQLAEIVEMFPDKNIILCDYSCSNINTHVKDLPLDRYGGTKKKKT
jgi:hypothetical protein